jgi:hypothetical protein
LDRSVLIFTTKALFISTKLVEKTYDFFNFLYLYIIVIKAAAETIE